MRILLLAFLALLFLIPVLLLCVTIVRRVAKAKWRLSIRGLLLFIAVLAVIMAGTIGYRRMAMARVEWLNPASVQAEHIFPNAEVVKRDDGRFAFTYYAKNRRVQRLSRPKTAASMRIDREAITIAASKKAVAEQVLEAMRESDQRPAGAFVIRGRVRDNYGRPLANAQVDLMGRFVFINCFQTRDDGTFTMALTDTNGSVPEGSLYYLRVRAATERKGHHVRWNSRYFSLKRSQPEMVVEIAVPGE